MLQRILIKQLLNIILPNGLKYTFRNGPLKGKTICGPLFSGIRTYANGNHETGVAHIIERLSPFIPSGSFYDIGAHIGYYSLLIPTLVCQLQPVHSFEPHPRTLRYLRKNLAQNISNFTINPIAVGPVNGRCLFLSIETIEAPQGSGLLETIYEPYIIKDKSQREIYVETATLDYLVYEKKLDLPSFIKMDIEGAEISVPFGARKLIAEQSAIWLAEIHKGKDLYQYCQFFPGYKHYKFLLDEIHTRVLSIRERLITSGMLHTLESCVREGNLSLL